MKMITVRRVIEAAAANKIDALADKLLFILGVNPKEIEETSRKASELRDAARIEDLLGDKHPLLEEIEEKEKREETKREREDPARLGPVQWKTRTIQQWEKAFEEAIWDNVIDTENIRSYDFYKSVQYRLWKVMKKANRQFLDHLTEEACSHIIAHADIYVRNLAGKESPIKKEPRGHLEVLSGDPNKEFFEPGAKLMMKVVGRAPGKPWAWEVTFSSTDEDIKVDSSKKYILDTSGSEIKMVRAQYAVQVISTKGPSVNLLVPHAQRGKTRAKITADQIPDLINRGVSDFQKSEVFRNVREKNVDDLTKILTDKVGVMKDLEDIEAGIRVKEEKLRGAHSDEAKNRWEKSLASDREKMNKLRGKLDRLVRKEETARRDIPDARYEEILQQHPLHEKILKYKPREQAWEGVQQEGDDDDEPSEEAEELYGKTPKRPYRPMLQPETTYTESDLEEFKQKIVRSLHDAAETEGATEVETYGLPYKVFVDLMMDEIWRMPDPSEKAGLGSELAAKMTEKAQKMGVFDTASVWGPAEQVGEGLKRMRGAVKKGARITTREDVEQWTKDMDGWDKIRDRKGNMDKILKSLKTVVFNKMDVSRILSSFRKRLLEDPQFKRLKENLVRIRMKRLRKKTGAELAESFENLMSDLKKAWRAPTVAKLKPLYVQTSTFSDAPGLKAQLSKVSMDGFADMIELSKRPAEFFQAMDIVDMLEALSEADLSVAVAERVKDTGEEFLKTASGEMAPVYRVLGTWPVLLVAADKFPWMKDIGIVREELQDLETTKAKRKVLLDQFNRWVDIIIGRSQKLEEAKKSGDTGRVETLTKKLDQAQKTLNDIENTLKTESAISGKPSANFISGLVNTMRKHHQAVLEGLAEEKTLKSRIDETLAGLSSLSDKAEDSDKGIIAKFTALVEQILERQTFLQKSFKTLDMSHQVKAADVSTESGRRMVEVNKLYDKLEDMGKRLVEILDKGQPEREIEKLLGAFQPGSFDFASIDDKIEALKAELDKQIKYQEEFDKSKEQLEVIRKTSPTVKIQEHGTPVKHGVNLIHLVHDIVKDMRVWMLHMIHKLPNDQVKIDIYEEFLERYHNPSAEEVEWRNKLYADIKAIAEKSVELGEKIPEKPKDKPLRVKVPRRMRSPGEVSIRNIEQPAIIKQLQQKDPELLSELQAIFA